MPEGKSPKSSTWIRVHIIYPLIPFILDGVIRFITSGYSLCLKTFSPATLAMSLAILCVFVNQSILTKNPPIPNDQDKEDIIGAASQFMTYTIFGVGGFCIIELLRALKEFRNVDTDAILAGFSWAIYCLSLLPIINAIRAQKSFKLRTTI